jgi:hypothetical protein
VGSGGTQIELIKRISTDLFLSRIKIRENQLNPRYPRSISLECDREASSSRTQIELIRRISTDLFWIRIKIRANQLDPHYPRSISLECDR